MCRKRVLELTQKAAGVLQDWQTPYGFTGLPDPVTDLSSGLCDGGSRFWLCQVGYAAIERKAVSYILLCYVFCVMVYLILVAALLSEFVLLSQELDKTCG